MPFPSVLVRKWVNAIAQLQFELAFFDFAVPHYNNFGMMTFSDFLGSNLKKQQQKNKNKKGYYMF